jgi:predicted CXXCH cytochrome family protein
MKKSLLTFLGIFAILLFFSSWSNTEREIDEGIKNPRKRKTEQKKCIECHSDLMNNKTVHAPIEEACDNCHSKQENDHPDRQGKEYTLADVMPSLCYNCHEQPSKKIIHAPVEGGECVICHSPHSSNNSHLLVNKSLSGLCYECHDLEIGETDKVHAPVETGSCEECHESHQSDNRSLLKNKKSQLCYSCHDNIKNETEAKYLHAAVDDCSNCHKSHSSKNRNLLSESIPELCFACHEPFDQKYGHSPVKEGDCLTCHVVHGSNNRKLLIEKEPSNLCLMCHDLGMENSKVKHAPVEGGECMECHDAHDSKNNGLLKKEKTMLCMNCHSDLEEDFVKINRHAPFEDDCSNCHASHSSMQENLLIDEAKTLCYTCHDDIQEKVKTEPIVHKVMNDALSCSNCHSPHASNESAILVSKEKELCLSCHNKEYLSELGKIKNIKEEIDKSKYVHEPVKEGCSSCHDPHAVKYPFLLTDYSSPMMYTPANTLNFQLCFNCHDKELMTIKRGNLATNFRNGNKNLHYVHLEGEKARNCNICHATHAADGKYLIKEKIWFGQWEMPIGFEADLNGGSCLTGCHKKMEYNRSPGL